VDGVHHHLDRAVEELLGLFRVAILDQLGRALDIGEQDGDLLALTSQRVTAGQDLLD